MELVTSTRALPCRSPSMDQATALSPYVPAMKLRGINKAETTYVDTPEGIFTASGVWFRTREAMLREYAGMVFDREPLERLLHYAEVWLRSPQTLALWVLPFFLLFLSPLQSALATLVIYVGWQSLGPSFVSRVLLPVFRLLDKVLLQAVYYVFILSIIAAQEQFVALAVGLGGFIVLRWGLVRLAVKPLVAWIWSTLYRMPVPDHVLRAMIVRMALKYRITLDEFDRIEREIIKNLKRK